jgi:hypothetical protein
VYREAAFLALAAILLTALAAAQYRPHTFLKGDCPYYAAAALSLLRDGDLDLRNQIRGGLEVHGTQVALGVRGEWYPKHPVLMSIASLPFFVLGGLNGALVFNVAVLLLLSAGVARAGDRLAGPPAGLIAAALILATTFVPQYVYNYSPDLFGTLLVVGGFAGLLGGRPALAGLLLAAAVWVKPTNLVFFAGGGAYLVHDGGWRRGGDYLAGGLPVIAMVAALQHHMFGAPWHTGYDRTLVLADGVPALVTHRDFFDLPFWRGFLQQLFLPGRGLLVAAPILWFLLPGSVLFLRRRRAAAILTLSTCAALFLLMCKYRYWSYAHAGNRFLFPLLFLSVLPLSCLIDWLLRNRTGGSGRPGLRWEATP